jgi:hypothetical protein
MHFNAHSRLLPPTQSIQVLGATFATSSNYFRWSSNRLVFVVVTRCFLWVRNWSLYFLELIFVFSDFKLSVQSQPSQRDQNVGTRQTSKRRNQPKCSPLPPLLHTPAVYLPSPPPFRTAIPYLQPAFSRRTRGHCLENFRDENFVSACNNCISHDTPTLFLRLLV